MQKLYLKGRVQLLLYFPAKTSMFVSNVHWSPAGTSLFSPPMGPEQLLLYVRAKTFTFVQVPFEVTKSDVPAADY